MHYDIKPSFSHIVGERGTTEWNGRGELVQPTQ